MPRHNGDKTTEEKFARDREYYREHRIAKRIANLTFRIRVRAMLGKNVSNPAFNIGFLQDSIIGNPLAHPHTDGEWLNIGTAQPGKFVGYDHRRPESFPKAYKSGKLQQVYEGRLAAFLIDEVRDKEPDELTPLGLFNILDLDHFLQFNTYTPEELVRLGVIVHTTYSEAYGKLGIYEQFAEELEQRRVSNDIIYQVTPKGNTLVKLLQDDGSPKAKEEPLSSYEPALARARVY